MNAPVGIEVAPNSRRGAYTQFGYKSVRTLGRDGVSAQAGTGELHAERDLRRLINASRMFYRDNSIYQGLIGSAVRNVIGRGWTLRATTDDSDWNTKAEALWRRFWKRPGVRNTLSGRRIERMVCREQLICGHTGVALTDVRGGALQLFEAEQFRHPSRRRSDRSPIEVDGYGSPSRYWLAPWTGTRVDPTKARAYTPETFLFVSDPERPSGMRSVPPAQASFPMLHRINDVCDSEAVAYQMLSRIALSITRETGGPLPGEGNAEDPTKTATDGDLATQLTELDYALIFHGKKGEKVEGVDRNVPGKNFSETLRMFLRLMGLPLGLPLEVILLDWTKSNYSQSRAVLEQAFLAFMEIQDLLEDLFYTPVYEWWLQWALSRGELKPRADQALHAWRRPTFPWLDKLKEAQAYGEKVDRGFCSFTSVVTSLNDDPDRVRNEIKRETIEAIKAAQEIKEETGVEVPWEPFAGKKAPLPVSQPAEKKDDDQDDDDEEDQDDDKKTDDQDEDEDENA